MIVSQEEVEPLDPRLPLAKCRGAPGLSKTANPYCSGQTCMVDTAVCVQMCVCEWVNVRQYCKSLWIKVLYECNPFTMIVLIYYEYNHTFISHVTISYG